ARGDTAALEALDAQAATSAQLPGEQLRAARLRRAERARRDGRLGDAEAELWAAVELTATEEQAPLLKELEALYEEAGRWADLVVLLNHHAPLAVDDRERRALDLRRVHILVEQLGTPKLAVEVAEQALERHGPDAELLAALADAARAAGDDQVLAGARAAMLQAARSSGDEAAAARVAF